MTTPLTPNTTKVRPSPRARTEGPGVPRRRRGRRGARRRPPPPPRPGSKRALAALEFESGHAQGSHLPRRASERASVRANTPHAPPRVSLVRLLLGFAGAPQPAGEDCSAHEGGGTGRLWRKRQGLAVCAAPRGAGRAAAESACERNRRRGGESARRLLWGPPRPSHSAHQPGLRDLEADVCKLFMVGARVRQRNERGAARRGERPRRGAGRRSGFFFFFFFRECTAERPPRHQARDQTLSSTHACALTLPLLPKPLCPF